MGSGGAPLRSLLFSSASGASDSGVYYYPARTRFALDLQPGVETLRIENWSTGLVLVDLDLRGHLQLLCIDRPCLSICASPGSDAGVAQQDGAGAMDTGVVVDGGVADAATASSAPDASGED